MLCMMSVHVDLHKYLPCLNGPPLPESLSVQQVCCMHSFKDLSVCVKIAFQPTWLANCNAWCFAFCSTTHTDACFASEQCAHLTYAVHIVIHTPYTPYTPIHLSAITFSTGSRLLLSFKGSHHTNLSDLCRLHHHIHISGDSRAARPCGPV